MAKIARWSSLVARRAHNPKAGGSNPSLATFIVRHLEKKMAIDIEITELRSQFIKLDQKMNELGRFL